MNITIIKLNNGDFINMIFETITTKYLLPVAQFFIKLFGKDMWIRCKNIRFGDYNWEPISELKNNGNFKKISNFSPNIKIDIENFDLKLNKETKDLDIVRGEHSFIQSLITYIHTENEINHLTGDDYGNEFSHSIFIAKNYQEYCRQCQYLAEKILNHETFKDYIQQIYSICRKKDKLIIEMKVYNKPETLVCVVPMYKSKKEHKKRFEELAEISEKNKSITNHSNVRNVKVTVKKSNNKNILDKIKKLK